MTLFQRSALGLAVGALVLAYGRTVGPVSRLPATFSVCEMNNARVCGTWTRQPDGTYRGSWEDGATAEVMLTWFTKTKIQVRRFDYGKNRDFSAEYDGVVHGRTATGRVIWKIQGTRAEGRWTATW